MLKPLCGVDPLTELALESFFLVTYPDYQLVFGVQCETDPVLDVLARLRARYPERDVTRGGGCHAARQQPQDLKSYQYAAGGQA